MELGHTLGHASGPSDKDCHFICLRYPEKWGFKPEHGESWVFRAGGGMVHSLYGGRGWFTGLWRSPKGCVYVTDSVLGVHICQDARPPNPPFKVHKLDATLAGVWGLDDENVFAWGIQRNAPVLFRWDGSAWSDMPSPGDVVAMHGTTPKLLYAVGAGGLIAHWNGRAWKRSESPTKSVLSAVFVAAADEVYAVSTTRQGGELLRRDKKKFAEVCRGPGPLYGVAKFREDVWVGAGSHGLMKLDGGALVVAKPNIPADRLDARGNLVISSPDGICETADGKNFTRTPVKSIASALAKTPPKW
jgi:hypothetical protein